MRKTRLTDREGRLRDKPRTKPLASDNQSKTLGHEGSVNILLPPPLPLPTTITGKGLQYSASMEGLQVGMKAEEMPC
jgi:hypothetical protein